MQATGRILDAGLKLLDRQLVDSPGMQAGKVPPIGQFGASLRPMP
jgi:hypothetical protein